MSTPPDQVETRTFATAAALIDALRLTPRTADPLPWQTPDATARDWLFRGHGDSDWRLSPSIFRGAPLPLDPDHAPWSATTDPEARIRAEHWLLHRFATMADVQGLRVPPEALAHFDAHHDPDPKDWIPTPLRPLAALAQHYGVPTRLLDWTRKPLVAAWFAAAAFIEENDKAEAINEALKKARDGATDADRAALDRAGKAPPNHLCVWALDKRKLPDHVAIVRAPRADNPNLHLQSGVFTHIAPERTETELTPLIPPGGLHKLTLPTAQLGDLLRLLRNEFIQGATVYAGYEGVKRSVLEHRHRTATPARK